MKALVLFFSLITCAVNYSHAQENSELDSTAAFTIPDSLLLVNPFVIDSFACIPQPDPYPGIHPWPHPYPDPYPWIDSHNWINPLVYTIIFYPDKNCGEARYENGMLYSRCECNADSVRHGKSVFWQQNGKISSVSYYSNGKVYTQKTYSNGKVARLENYAYKNNEQLLHGKRIEYLDYGKIISYYDFGKKHGSEIEYMDGYLYAKRQHKNDVQVYEQLFDQKGRMISEASWTEAGIPTGTRLDIQPSINKTTYTTYHENGRKWEIRSLVNDLCIEHEKYSETGDLLHHESSYKDGSPRRYFHIDSTQTEISKEWSQDGQLLSDWRVRQHKLVGTGFYTSGTKRTEYKQVFNSDGSDHLECWTFVNGDTTSFYYARNQGGGFNGIMYENKFVQHNGKATKHGRWTVYQDKKVILQENYDHGILHGNWKKYAEVGGSHQLQIEGKYASGIRTDYWKVNTDSCQYHVLYAEDTIVGKILVYKEGKMTQEIRSSDKWEDCNIIFDIYEDGKERWICRYQNEIPNGKWIELHPDQTAKGYGFFKNGKFKSKWIELVPKKNGKMKKVRLKEISLPKPVFPNITELFSAPLT